MQVQSALTGCTQLWRQGLPIRGGRRETITAESLSGGPSSTAVVEGFAKPGRASATTSSSAWGQCRRCCFSTRVLQSGEPDRGHGLCRTVLIPTIGELTPPCCVQLRDDRRTLIQNRLKMNVFGSKLLIPGSKWHRARAAGDCHLNQSVAAATWRVMTMPCFMTHSPTPSQSEPAPLLAAQGPSTSASRPRHAGHSPATIRPCRPIESILGLPSRPWHRRRVVLAHGLEPLLDDASHRHVQRPRRSVAVGR